MRNNKKKGMPLYLRGFMNIIIVGAILIASIMSFKSSFKSSYNIVTTQSEKESDPNIKEVKINIQENATTDDIATILHDSGLISNKIWFKAQSRLGKYDGKYQQGEFALNTTMKDRTIMKILTTPTVIEDNIKFTIPEGYNINQIAQRLEDLEIVKKDDFIQAATQREYDYEFLKDVNNKKKYKLEGYLFPDTYFVRKDTTSEEIIIKMLNRFEEITDKYKQELRNLPYSFEEIITVASIVEQEARLDEERPIISGVMYNRLEDGMKLQMCSTVQYALEKRTANLSYTDLEVESPYNTYKYEGLPVGPICSPGEASIKAAFQPEEHDYYFFVLKNQEEGSHEFSKTANEHNNKKARYKQSIDKNFHQ